MSEQNELRVSLEKTSKACANLRVFCLVCCAFVFGVSCFRIMGSVLAGDSVLVFAIVFLLQITTLFVLLVLVRALSGPAKGESPFTHEQPARLLMLAGLFASKFFADFAVPMAMLYSAPHSFGAKLFVSGVSSGVLFDVGVSLLLFSLIMVCLSVVFRYGSLLQRLSDETV
ncbi:MAG: hypothetical protein U0M72_02410 [Eggerthellaceae bacterium]